MALAALTLPGYGFQGFEVECDGPYAHFITKVSQHLAGFIDNCNAYAMLKAIPETKGIGEQKI